jgi:hypothetical protein
VGVAGIAGFLLTGQYMDKVHDHLRGMEDAQRLLFRSTHIYLLLGSLVNLALGLYSRPGAGWRHWMRLVGSLLVVTAPFVQAIAFFTEPWLSGLQRPYTGPAIYACYGGMLLHLVAMSRETRARSPE